MSQTIRQPEADASAGLRQAAQAELERIRAGFLLRRPFLAMVALRLDLKAVVDDRLRTAATNGRSIYFDARFLFECSEEKRVFVFAHEVWHCALGHMSRVGSRMANLWNLAADHEVNALLRDDGFPLPEDAVLFEDCEGLNAEAVYDWLLQNGVTAVHAFDLHLPRPDLLASEVPIDIGHEIEIDPGFLPAEAPPSTTASDNLRRSAAQDTRKRHGTLPGIIRLELDRLAAPTVDWRPILDRFVRSASASELSWARPQRRHLHAGVYLPARRRTRLNVSVAIDVSGSVFDIAGHFLSEAAGLLAQNRVAEIDLLFFDVVIQSRGRFTTSEAFRGFLQDVSGGGGTNFLPLFEEGALDPTTSALIILTDGFGLAPEEPPRVPTLWALTPRGEQPVPWGECLRMTSCPRLKGY